MLLASALNASQVISGGSNVDSGPWGQAGVPYGAPMIANQVISNKMKTSPSFYIAYISSFFFCTLPNLISWPGLFPVSSHGAPAPELALLVL
jgi:hypothetical protein